LNKPRFEEGHISGNSHLLATEPEKAEASATSPSCSQGDIIMLIQQDNHTPITSYDTPLQTFASTDEVVDARQPILALQVGSHLDPGLKRKNRPNEDTIFVTHGFMTSPSASPKLFALLMVADGMGGQAHGQEASRLAVGSLAEYVSVSLRSQQMTSEAFLPLRREGVRYAHPVVYQRNRERRTDMGTTMTAALVIDNTAYVAHVGDSRFYLFREPNGLSQITQDHSLVAALVAAGAIQPEDIYTHPMRNLIYRCLGEKSKWEMIHDQQIAAILTTPMPDPSGTAHALIQAALAGGGVDNVSAIVVQVSKV
jgi:serine/threonine protein phosphatase PrpC